MGKHSVKQVTGLRYQTPTAPKNQGDGGQEKMAGTGGESKNQGDGGQDKNP